jgi:predicted phosphodiesterase
VEFASTFPREEMFFLLDKFAEWNASIVFLGHVHKWDYEKVNGVEYLTLDSMSSDNNPDPGDYLIRVHVKKDGTIKWEPVHMSYTAK